MDFPLLVHRLLLGDLLGSNDKIEKDLENSKKNYVNCQRDPFPSAISSLKVFHLYPVPIIIARNFFQR